MSQLSFDLNAVTALGPNDPDDGDPGRQRRGMAIAALVRVERNRLGYKVPSQSGNGSYVVNTDNTPFCTCPDFERRQMPCKHIYAVQVTIQREELPDGTTVETTSVTTTNRREWSVYNEAQEREGEHFPVLLNELCGLIEQSPQPINGRPRLPLADVVQAIAHKVYSGDSGRRAMSTIRSAQSDGLMVKAPSFTSLHRYMENPAVTPVLRDLIRASALPVAPIETTFAVDSSGFASSVYDRWFDHKWNREIKGAKWVKAHIMCGTRTNVVTVADATATATADSPYWRPFVEATAEHFEIAEVSGDKAYLSRDNLHAVNDVGGTPYIMFKSNSVLRNRSHKYGRDLLWEKMLGQFLYQREEYLRHYHLRSNVETAFSMVKAKFGGNVMAKTPTAQVNEVLAKLLCHNISAVIRASYELGVPRAFDFRG